MERLNSVDEAVERAIAAVGKNIVLGAPLGLGKPVQLMNAFYRRAEQDSEISLHIFTALSLSVPRPGSAIEASLAGPITERLFGDYEELEYVHAVQSDSLPANIQVTELYFKAGSMKNVASAQRNYISSNYTHIARDLVDRGVNVLAQMVATRETSQGVSVSLSSNPDTGIDVINQLRTQRPGSYVAIAQAHADMPFMEHDAEVDPKLFDMLVENPEYDKTLFAVPNASVPLQDYATAIHASSLVADGGTLQIGIGSLGDAVAHALIVRQRDNVQYRNMLSALTRQSCELVENGRSFDRGLYVSTEMFVNGMVHLMEQGVVKRKVYDNLLLQVAINDGTITESIDAQLYDFALDVGLIPGILTESSLQQLQYWGILPHDTHIEGENLIIAGRAVYKAMDSQSTREAVLTEMSGLKLRHGRLLHGGFFLGPADFYQKLRELDAEGSESICMTSVLRTNQLLGDFPLYCAQRQKARFINTGMMATLTGAVASDALENGSVVSGVGGQYNFVAMAHDLPGARSILCIRSTRGHGDELKSNIVPFYGHITIPKHLRDVIVTEYGVADLRGQSDAEIIKRMINIADSRFQDELLSFAKENGKVEAGYEIPETARDNTPQSIAASLAPFVAEGLLPDYPFGTQLTNEEIALAGSLRKIKALADEPTQFVPKLFKALLHRPDEDAVKPWLERIHLEHPGTTQEFLVQQLLLLELEERGLLRGS
ncbi:MAG: acetyl-CoA hydrolase/transferase C-terminal domain-containing protein [Halioglobus sp.]